MVNILIYKQIHTYAHLLSHLFSQQILLCANHCAWRIREDLVSQFEKLTFKGNLKHKERIRCFKIQE